MIIVTQNQYVLAAKIHHIVMNENYEYHDVRTHSGRIVGVRELTYLIHITYVPETVSTTNSPRDGLLECTVQIRGKVNAHKVYADLINQIREQSPDQLFLDKAMENLLNQNNFAVIQKSEEDEKREMREILRDRRTKKVRRTRKAKRTNKAVLRKLKTLSRKRR